MVQEPFFTLPVVAVPTVQDTVVTAPVVSSHMATMNEHEEPVLQDPEEPVVTHEGEQQQPHIEQASSNETPRRSQRVRRSVIPDDYEVYECEEVQMEGDPTSFVAPGFKDKTRYTRYVSPGSQISHIATNKGNIKR